MASHSLDPNHTLLATRLGVLRRWCRASPLSGRCYLASFSNSSDPALDSTQVPSDGNAGYKQVSAPLAAFQHVLRDQALVKTTSKYTHGMRVRQSQA